MNIPFSLTTAQYKARIKDVTRRLGFKKLRRGDRLIACEKCQGIPKGGHVVKLGVIEVVSVRRERLAVMIADPRYGKREAIREGFPKLSGRGFVKMFCSHMKCSPWDYVTRIEFKYV